VYCSSSGHTRAALDFPAASIARHDNVLHALPTQVFLCRYLSSMLFQSIRAECAQMDINERVMLTDEAGKSFYVPPL
jgi:hypothetical protein